MTGRDDNGIDTGVRQRAYRLGLSAETRAALFLQLKGYRILARRFRSARGEIDLIARKRRTLVFIEVKARRNVSEAVDAVGPTTRRRIEAAASAWGAKFPTYQDFTWRYDIIAIVPGRWPVHMIEAFRTSD